ncbi:acetate/propionate family kinase [Sphingomonas sp. ABOLG]|uniref:acetate/propionate family kinase n=1 Tax=Sphingomonas sp. ABOLG TaxID=1985880 RepID=UPI000F7EA603|nr:acetate/propionate family kinase [Sphingomonas sp. ABOLG]RSV14790.1 acetate/propionate family kinase [Sphingomonas sp. ABOLG]
MNQTVLVLNAGSSSLKFAIYARGEPLRLLAKGAASRLGEPDARLRVKRGDEVMADCPLAGPISVTVAAEAVFAWLDHAGLLAGVEAVGHRIVHGGGGYVDPVILDEGVLQALRRLTPLAPLHQPYNLDIVEFAGERVPQAPQVGCFDTAFHATRPWLERLYALPRELISQGLVAYGFHGLSYDYVAGVLKARDPHHAGGRAIVAHLGSGASLCAMSAGRSVATTMGFSALDGLVMSSRCGSLDPGIILYLLQDRGMSADDVSAMLYQRSGLLGVSGISGDMATLLTLADPHAVEAVELFVYRVAREIGSLVAALGGLDTLVFTAGIGENAPEIRAKICAAAAWLGLSLDPPRNRAGDEVVSSEGSAVEVLVIPTDEELAVAKAAAHLARA